MDWVLTHPLNTFSSTTQHINTKKNNFEKFGSTLNNSNTTGTFKQGCQFFVTCKCLYFGQAWIKYSSGFTRIKSRHTEKEDGSEVFPYISVCPVKAFKSRGFFYTKSEFLQNTYTVVRTNKFRI